MAIPWIVVVALAVHYRVRDVGRLPVLGDEQHAVRVGAQYEPWDILTTHFAADNSIPYTLWAHLLIHYEALDEVTLRLPVLISGLALCLAPFLFLRRGGQPDALACGLHLALVAASPGLVYFSFVARPYAVAMLGVVGALWAWDAWRRHPSTAHLLAMSVSAALAVFFHLFAIFPVAALFGVALGEAALGRRPGRRRGVLASGAVTAALLALALGPGASSLFAAHAEKLGTPIDASGFLSFAWSLATGSTSGLVWLLAAALPLGFALDLRRDRAFAMGAGAVVLSVLVGLLVLRPEGTPYAWSRYLLLVWPVALLLAARGLADAVRWLARRAVTAWPATAAGAIALALDPVQLWAPGALGLAVGAASLEAAWSRRRGEAVGPPVITAGAAPLLLGVGLLLLSPVRVLARSPDSFRSDRGAQIRDYPRPVPVPALYQRIARDPAGGEAVLEVPSVSGVAAESPYCEYQRVHGKHVVMPVFEANPTPFSGLHTLVNLFDERDVRASGARYAVLHRDVAEHFPKTVPFSERELLDFKWQYRAARSILRRRCGKFVDREGDTLLFDLARWREPSGVSDEEYQFLHRRNQLAPEDSE